MGGVPALPNLTGGAGGAAGPAVTGPVTFTGGTVNVQSALTGNLSTLSFYAAIAGLGYYLWKKYKK